MLCDDLKGWDGGVGRRLTREGLHVYIRLIHAVVQRTLTQHCKAVMFRLGKKLLTHTQTVKSGSSSSTASLLLLIEMDSKPLVPSLAVFCVL